MKKILYVDDEYINCQLFEITLSKKFNVLIAESAKKGLEILENNKDIKVVISDMKMPKMNGLEFVKIANEKYPLISYFILSGFDLSSEIQTALDTGLILKYFTKPFSSKDIQTEIMRVIGE